MEAFLPDYLAVTTTACDATHARLELVGELDMISCVQLEDALAYHLRRGRRFVSVDLAGVTFMDAAAIGAFVLAQPGNGLSLFSSAGARSFSPAPCVSCMKKHALAVAEGAPQPEVFEIAAPFQTHVTNPLVD